MIGACGLQDGGQVRLEQVDRTMLGKPLVRLDKPGRDGPAVAMTHKQTPARVAPLALITIVLVTGFYFVCEYYKVPLWLTVVFAVVLAILCVHRVERAFRPDGWMNVKD